eukprot:scaffold11867_cov60-Phaeocystis_antarctica.AAC.2
MLVRVLMLVPAHDGLVVGGRDRRLVTESQRARRDADLCPPISVSCCSGAKLAVTTDRHNLDNSDDGRLPPY